MRNSVLYVTYCSRRKRKAPGRLPALDRYLSARIRVVAWRAKRDGAAFRILSGRYGLITAAYRIPHYDHLLQPGEVAGMTLRVAPKLRGYGRMVFWYEPNDYQTPYRAVLGRAAKRVHLALSFRSCRN